MHELRIIPLGANPRDLSFDALCRGIERVLPVRVFPDQLPIDIDFALDPSRKQYHSTELLARLLEVEERGEKRILGITPYDLFIPILTFVFGQAQFDNRAALFSTFRLHNEFYGLATSAALLEERCVKEALHELGHTYGLRHCLELPCVMNSSTYVEDIDLKPADFCLPCRSHLDGVF